MTTILQRTAQQIIKKAMLLCRAVDPNQDIDAVDYVTCLDTLNGMIKSWQAQGYNLWLLESAVLFLTTSTKSYMIGDDGDHCCLDSDFIPTTIHTAATAGDETLVVEDSTGMTGAPNIYANELTSDVNEWVGTYMTRSASGNTMTISNASDENTCFIELTITDLEPASSYRITYGYSDAGTGTGATFLLYDSDGNIDTATQTVTGTYTMDFTAAQTTATFRITQTSAVLLDTALITAWNMVDKETGDYVGVELTAGTRQWLRLVSVSGDTLSLSGALIGNAAADLSVYTYSTKIDKPMRIMDVMYEQTIGNGEVPIENVPRKTYMQQTDKVTSGSITSVYYQPLINDGKMFVWNTSNNCTSLIKFGYVKPMEVLIDTASEPLFPSEWYLPLAYALAALIAPEYKTDANKLMYLEQKSAQLLESVLTYDNENESLFIGLDND